jgi:four helix bundle protein
VAADFVDLLAWRRAVALVREVVRLAPQVRGPGAAETVEQVMRAAESVAANIAEGYGRGPGRDFARFLRIAAASAAETESHLRVAEACGRLPAEAVAAVISHCREVRALVNGLRKAIKAKGAD